MKVVRYALDIARTTSASTVRLITSATTDVPAVRFSPLLTMIASLHHEYGSGKPNRSHQPGLHQFVTFRNANTSTVEKKAAR